MVVLWCGRGARGGGWVSVMLIFLDLVLDLFRIMKIHCLGESGNKNLESSHLSIIIIKGKRELRNLNSSVNYDGR